MSLIQDFYKLVNELSGNTVEDIRIRYFSDTFALKYIGGEEKSNWVDLRCAEDVDLKAGEFKLISLGVAMELPKNYEALVVPRSSTFKNYGIIQANSVGVIDNSYCGDDDVWMMPVYATRDTHIGKNERIAQFRIFRKQPTLNFLATYHLGNENRGGLGSSGVY